MRPLRSTTTSSPASPATAGVSPIALLVCTLATLVAVPILVSSSDESRAEEVSMVVAADDDLSESALEPDIAMGDLLDAGARVAAVPEITDERSADPQGAALQVAEQPDGGQSGAAVAVVDPSSEPFEAAEQSAASADPIGAEEPAPSAAPQTSSTISDAPARPEPAPTTVLPTTTAPTTAPPTTPTTVAPTTQPPTTPAPATDQTADTTPELAAPAAVEAADESSTEQAAAAAPAGDVAAAAETPSGPTAEQWAALRQCEASGSYTIVSSNGLYHGAYQFYQPTWDGLARQLGRDDLVGVPPSQAAPADQDALALLLWQQRGAQPWPTCGRHLAPQS